MGTIENPQEEEVIKIERLIEDIENHPEDKVERILVTRNIGGEKTTNIYEVYFNTGNYEIGISSNYKIGQPIWEAMPIGLINGGLVKYKNVNLRYSITPDDWHKTWHIDKVCFTMPQDDAKLSDVFETTPYGLIKKNRTGVGATTLELNSPRNSIIVVPTKALAYEKTKSNWDKEIQKCKACYVGGDISGFSKTGIKSYLSDSEIKYKKFIVVANSLPRLLRAIGENCCKDYFFMVDEIDSYQYDNSYRPELEDVMDYYFQFPQKLRCLVSATVSDFSNPLINEEPVIEVQFKNPESRNIRLLHTENIVETAQQQIQYIRQEHPDEKILVAYNTISGIQSIIKALGLEKEDTAILCSEKSKSIVKEYYDKLSDTKLPKPLNFITCIYFVGVDINEPFHLISIADVRKPHTLLSEERLQQIAGRCRIPGGILSETVVYNSRPAQSANIGNTGEQAIEAANLLSNYANLIPLVKTEFPAIIPKKTDGGRIKKFIIKNSFQIYHGIKTAPLVRRNNNGSFKPSYFNIDNLLIQLKLRTTLYGAAETLYNQLEAKGHQVCFEEAETSSTEIYQEIEQQVKNESQQSIEEEREAIIQELRECQSTTEDENIEKRAKLAASQRMACCTQNRIFLDRFLVLQEYVPFEALIEELQKHDNPDKYNDFYNAAVFWSLSETHPLKILIRENFPLNEILTGDEITGRFNSIWTTWFSRDSLSNRQAIPKAKVFCKLSRRTTKRETGRLMPVSGYRIISYNSFDFNFSPLKKRPDTADAMEFDFYS